MTPPNTEIPSNECNTSLPGEGEVVIVALGNGVVSVGWHSSGLGWAVDGIDPDVQSNITHWQALPVHPLNQSFTA